MLVLADGPCPCGSTLSLAECCLPRDFPISRRGQGFARISLNATLMSAGGMGFPLPPGATVESTLRNPHQLDKQVMALMTELVDEIAAIGLNSDETDLIAAELGAMDDALHAVRYHQQQCLRRLHDVYVDNLFVLRPPTGNVDVLLDDMPFRFELEAFVVRARTCMDVLGRLSSMLLWKRAVPWGDFLKKALGQSRLSPDHRQQISLLSQRYSPWITELRDLRNAITHDGQLKGYRALGFQRSRLVEPTVLSSPADHLCFRSWAALREIIPAFIHLVVQARLAQEAG